ncbi:UvrD-helicase domain-containing protein [Litorilinea aerophila]|uniref:DNA 3'-5' helicase n=1 Tax=Litorilinea aerophila TaxID=1204385 RepID=A0A540VCX3_9CHLR|nr:UvrD-helicase domain-containing protein [Litorilinea aerophila]MCC9077642.1 UvrD-helicase domain-containing protein [Litorilinea aerophila]
MTRFVADLHIHSHYSRATSRDLTLEHLARWAQMKGVHVVGTGDIAHPGWLAEIREKLEPAEEGLFRLKPELEQAVQAQVPPACQAPVRFLLAGEVSNIYKKNGRVRKLHHVLFLPDLTAVEKLQARLEQIGNIRADGRPILGLDSRELLEILLETDPRAYLIPAHIWTPWFSLLGSMSGFDSVEECFEDLTPHIFALETGLSSDPPMNWRVSALDRYTLVSNSDAHSPQKLAREANLFNTELSYPAIHAALKSGDPEAFLGTVEFFPEEGKYHFDGHRKCGVRWHPRETRVHQGLCPVCQKPVTVGVMHRVESLADRPEEDVSASGRHPFHRLIPLPELLGEIHQVGPGSKTVQAAYQALLATLGPELEILLHLPLDAIQQAGGPLLAEGIRRMRAGQIASNPGFDGEYGVIQVFADEDPGAAPQLDLFGEMDDEALAEAPAGPRHPSGQQAPPSDDAPAVSPMPAVAEVEQAADATLEGTAETRPEHAEDAPIHAWEQPLLFGQTAPPSEAPRPPEGAASRVDAWPPLAHLNDEQRRAVLCVDRPLLIVAGPGTGKTRTLTYRLAYLMACHGVPPEQILAITFTNKAAEEMAERLAALTDAATAARVMVRTFHAFAAWLLREHGQRRDLSADFAICQEEERLALLRHACPGLTEGTCRQTLRHISQAKNELLPPGAPSLATRFPEVADFPARYAAYQAALRQHHLMDFDDLLGEAVALLQEEPTVRQALQQRFRWISVDEYQDVNLAQYRLLRLLTGDADPSADGRPNLCAIGDPDQAIYGFRGADRGYFLRFTEDYPDAQVLQLRQNYRSTQSILDAARQVIAQSAGREGDTVPLEIWSEFFDATRLEIYQAPTDRAEAEYVVHQIEQMVGGTSYFSLDSGRVAGTEEGRRAFADFAVLFRTHGQGRLLEEAFARSGIPYQVVGRRPLAEYREVRQVLAYLWLLRNPRSAFHLARLLGLDLPPAALGTVLASLPGPFWQLAEDAGKQVAAAVGLAGRPGTAWTRRWHQVCARLQELEALQGEAPLTRLLESLSQDLEGLDDAGQERLRQLMRRAIPFGQDLNGFLEALSLQGEADTYDPRADRVPLMTLHAAKGLEFPVVFIVGCEEGLLPYRRGEELRGDKPDDAAETAAGEEADVEEERRLFYVGLTRAREKLILTHARRRHLYGRRMANEPSRFLADIEETLKEVKEMAQRKTRPDASRARPTLEQLRLFET